MCVSVRVCHCMAQHYIQYSMNALLRCIIYQIMNTLNMQHLSDHAHSLCNLLMCDSTTAGTHTEDSCHLFTISLYNND